MVDKLCFIELCNMGRKVQTNMHTTEHIYILLLCVKSIVHNMIAKNIMYFKLWYFTIFIKEYAKGSKRQKAKWYVVEKLPIALSLSTKTVERLYSANSILLKTVGYINAHMLKIARKIKTNNTAFCVYPMSISVSTVEYR